MTTTPQQEESEQQTMNRVKKETRDFILSLDDISSHDYSEEVAKRYHAARNKIISDRWSDEAIQNKYPIGDDFYSSLRARSIAKFMRDQFHPISKEDKV